VPYTNIPIFLADNLLYIHLLYIEGTKCTFLRTFWDKNLSSSNRNCLWTHVRM